jgi:SPP1 gp7 family putative phage head morphogenesis protein
VSHQAGIRAALEAAYRTRPKARPKRQADKIPQLPKTAEALYVRALRGIVKKIGEATKEVLGPHVEALKAEQRTDAAGDVITGAAFETLRDRIAEIVGDVVIAGVVNAAVDGVNRKNLAEMSRVLGIDPRALFPGAEDVMEAWRRANVDLIKSIGGEYLDQVQDLVRTATTEGIRAEALAEALQERLGVAASRAELIARDQVLKANAQLSTERMLRVGVTSYKWSTSKDSRVRRGHRALDGEIIQLNDPPIVDPKTGRRAHAGEDFQCRCVKIPQLDD